MFLSQFMKKRLAWWWMIQFCGHTRCIIFFLFNFKTALKFTLYFFSVSWLYFELIIICWCCSLCQLSWDQEYWEIFLMAFRLPYFTCDLNSCILIALSTVYFVMKTNLPVTSYAVNSIIMYPVLIDICSSFVLMIYQYRGLWRLLLKDPVMCISLVESLSQLLTKIFFGIFSLRK